MVVHPQIRDALRGHDDVWLAERVSALEGRQSPYPGVEARDWIERPELQLPSRIFAVEAALGLVPASLSRCLGYLPTDVSAAERVEAAVAVDRSLPEAAEREFLRAFRAARTLTTTPHDSSAFGAALTAAVDGMNVAQLASRLGGIPRIVLREWMSGQTAPPPYVVFRLEQILALPPGALARHLGYVPINVEPARDVEDAISHDPLLEETDRDLLIGLYRSLTGAAPSRN